MGWRGSLGAGGLGAQGSAFWCPHPHCGEPWAVPETCVSAPFTAWDRGGVPAAAVTGVLHWAPCFVGCSPHAGTGVVPSHPMPFCSLRPWPSEELAVFQSFTKRRLSLPHFRLRAISGTQG